MTTEAQKRTLIRNRKKRKPSASLAMTPEKACKIVKDGQVHGKPLTDAQRGLFGARCGQRTNNTTQNPTTETTNMKLTPRQREEHVTFITTNCACWSGKGDAKVLNAFPDEKLIELKEHVEEEMENKAVVNAAREGFTLAGVEFTVNSDGRFIAKKGNKEIDVVENNEECGDMMYPKDKKKGKKKGPPIPSATNADDDDEEDDEDDDQPAKNGNQNGKLTKQMIGNAVSAYLKSLTPEQHLQLLPPDVQTAVRNGMKSDKKARTKLIGLLVSNVKNEDEKKKHTARYAKWTTDDLEEEVALRGLSRNSGGNDGNSNPNDLDAFFGGSGGGDYRPRDREITVNADDVLPLPGDPGYLVTANVGEDDDDNDE